MLTTKQLLCAAAVAACGFSGAATAQQVIVQPAPAPVVVAPAPAPTVVAPAPVVVAPTPAPVVVYQPGTVTVKERPMTVLPDGTSIAEDK